MNKYEKIFLAILGTAIVGATIFAVFEATENSSQEIREGEASDFDKSFGDTFAIMSFSTITSSSSSADLEENCNLQKPVIASVLYDLKENMETFGDELMSSAGTFQINQEVLALFCHKTAEISLVNTDSDTLTLQKVPFIRKIPNGGDPDDIGTLVKIDATQTRSTDGVENVSTTSAEMIIPDKLLQQ